MNDLRIDYKKNLCPLPWVELSANADTTLRVCCNTYHKGLVKDNQNNTVSIMSDEPIESLFNKKTHREIRKSMLSGERPSFCKSCYDVEDLGGQSVRNSFFEQYENRILDIIQSTNSDGTINSENIQIRKIDLALSNLCSLKCRMCAPSCSTLLKKEFDELGFDYSTEEHHLASTEWKIKIGFKMIFEKHCKHLEEIYTTGGEPFISFEHKEILKIVKAQGYQNDIQLSYHTSLTHLPEDLIDLWRGFKVIQINVSIEGVETTNDYARYPSKWTDILKNLERLNDLSHELNLNIIVHSCVQAITWLQHFELFKFTAFLSSKNTNIPCIPNPIWLENPNDLSALCLPMDLRLLGISRIENAFLELKKSIGRSFTNSELEYYNSYQVIFKKLQSTPFQLEHFFEFRYKVRAVDMYRNQNILEIVPEFENYFKMEDEIFNAKKNKQDSERIKRFAYNALLENNFEKAAMEFRRSWDLNKDDAEACYNVGFALKNLKRKSEAENFFRQTLAIDPCHYFSLIEIGFMEVRLGRHKKAIELLNRALLNEPEIKKGETKTFLLNAKIDRYCFWRWCYKKSAWTQ
jgi:MoaA/NifB/PqqE/SkfB family radical SAM enzyme